MDYGESTVKRELRAKIELLLLKNENIIYTKDKEVQDPKE